MTVWALERRYSGDGLNFDEMEARDGQIHRLNAAAISLYSASAIAGAAWLWLTLLPSAPGRSEVSIAFGSTF